MTTDDERHTQPLPTDQPDDPGATPQEDTMTSTTEVPGPAPAPVTTTPPRRGLRVGTIVWGLVLAALGAGVVAWAVGIHFDVELAFIVLVAASGVLLLAGSLATTLRRRR